MQNINELIPFLLMIGFFRMNENRFFIFELIRSVGGKQRGRRPSEATRESYVILIYY